MANKSTPGVPGQRARNAGLILCELTHQLSRPQFCSLLLVAIAVVCPKPAFAQTETAEGGDTVVYVGQPVSRQHGSGQPIQYRFTAEQGKTYLIEVDQVGLDLIVTAQDPYGVSASYDSPLKRDGIEFLLLDEPAAGEYLLTIESREPTHAIGGHNLRISEVESPDGVNSGYVDAHLLMTRAAMAYATGDSAVVDQVASDYIAAAQIWRDLDRRAEVAQSLFSAAMLEYWNFYNWSRCATLSAEAAAIYAELGAQSLYASALFLQGAAKLEEANELQSTEAQPVFDTAMELIAGARRTHEERNNPFEAAQVNNTLGLAYYYVGSWALARSTWIEAADEFREIGEWLEELRARQNIAVLDGLQGYNGKAIETLQAVLGGLPEEASLELRANVLDNLAENHRLNGDFDDSLRLYNNALDVHREIDDAIGEAYSLRGIGNTYFSLGKLDLASKYLEEALPGAVAANDGRSQEEILARLGDIAHMQAEHELALDFHQDALRIAASGPDKAHRQIAVARDLLSLNRLDEALALATESSDLASASEAIGTYADAQVQIGRIQIALGRPDDARPHFENALAAYDTLGLNVGQADAYDGLATSASIMGRLNEAVQHGYRSIAHVERLREKVAVPELRAEYSAANRAYYDSQIDTLMSLQRQAKEGDAWLRDALATSERSRARMAIDLLREASARSDTSARVDGGQRQLYEELAAKRYQRDRMLRNRSVDESTRGQIAELTSAMTELENELNVVATEIRLTDPEFAGLSAADTLTVDDMQAMVDEDSVLLHYSLGESRSFVWIITSDSVDAVELADRSTLEATALLVVDGLRILDTGQSARRRLEQNLEQLSSLIVEPIAEHLGGTARLLLALDGALQYVPFGVLSITVNGTSHQLLTTHEIVNVPSLSVVSALRARATTLADKTIAVFADPVTSTNDPRLAAVLSGTGRSSSTANSVFEEIFPDLQLGRLPSTAQEAQFIRDSVPDDLRFIAEGFDASLNVVNSLSLSDYRFLHFATHGVVDTRYPLLSALVLSRYDQQGSTRPGLLRLYDVFGLDLNADLVVLSACDTALGQDIRGEGIIGLAQGFMFAGADGVLVSLWPVSDQATAELMTRFYRAMLEEGRPASQALSFAQRSLAEDRRWRHPYFWAPFILLGDWD